MHQNEDKANFEENAKKELASELYNGLEEELALAAVTLNWLTPLLNERNSASSRPAAAEPKTAEAEPTEPAPAATQPLSGDAGDAPAARRRKRPARPPSE